jgi:EmrB/QacA subfamily drug resistance transporter
VTGRPQSAKPSGGVLRLSSSRGRWIVAATVLGSAMVAIDSTVVGIALPTIGRQFHAGVADLQWVTNGYTLSLAGLLLFGGSLGDRLGRRRVFVVGSVWFAVGSLLCGAAPNAPVLIGMRVLQGAGGALLTPGSLAILESAFATDADRARAIGAWSGLGGVALAIAPSLGGWLVSDVSWRLIFFINIPLAIAVVAVSLRHVPESKDPAASRGVDAFGVVAVSLGLAGLTYGLTEGASLGWRSPATVAALVVGTVLLAAFVVHEVHSATSLLPMRLFRSSAFSGTTAATFFVYAALGGAFFFLPIELQQVSRYSPLAAGAALLPVTVIMLALSARSGQLAARIGPRLQMSIGPVVAAGGLALLATVSAGGSYLTQVLPALAVLGLGLVMTVAPLRATALGSAPPGQAGVASAVNNDVARVGGLVAVAVLPFAAGITGDSYLHPARFLAGFHVAMAAAAVACAAGGVISLLLVRGMAPAGPAPGGPAPGRPETGRPKPGRPKPGRPETPTGGAPRAGSFVCGADSPQLWPEPDRGPVPPRTGGRR